MLDYLSSKESISGIKPMYKHMSVYDSLKRIFDIMLSIVGLLITFPILLVTVVLIVLESEGGWLYKQQRVGINGSVFMIYKLRTMYNNCSEGWTERNDPRITMVGRFIRKTRIDEIPQLVNVLKGDMSLIGPRPERPLFESMIVKELHGFRERTKVKPGITGWAQVNGGYNLSHAEKLEMDLYYIRNRSFLLDAKILLLTFIVVIAAKGAR